MYIRTAHHSDTYLHGYFPVALYADGVFCFLEEIITLLEIEPRMRFFFLFLFCTPPPFFLVVFTDNEVIGKTS